MAFPQSSGRAMRRRVRRLRLWPVGALCGSLAGTALAEGVAAIPYDDIRVPPGVAIGWGEMATHSDSIIVLDGPHRREGAVLGESFAGQVVTRQRDADNVPHDLVTGTPEAPLRVVPGPDGRNLAVAPRDPHFGRPVLLPTGPGGPDQNIHGEGSVAILFDEDQCLFGIRLFLDGTPGGGVAAEDFGIVNLKVYDRDGGLIAEVRRSRRSGILSLAYRRDGGAGDIAGLLLQNVDPAGIAIDEIRFATACDPPVA